MTKAYISRLSSVSLCASCMMLNRIVHRVYDIYNFQVTSQLSENGGISTATRDRIKLLCGNISEISNFTQFAEFTDEQDCTDAVTRALDRIPEFNDTNDFQSSELLR